MDSDAMHKAILDCMKEPVCVRDRDMNLLYMNPAAKLLSGLSVEASQGKNYYEVFAHIEHSSLSPLYEAGEFIGEVVIMQLPIGSDNMDRTGFKSVVDEKRNLSRPLLLEDVLNGLRDVVGIQLPDHTVIRYNKAGYDMLGLSPADVTGKKCYQLIGKSQQCEVCATARAVQSKQSETVETFIPELGRHFLCSSNPILGADGEIQVIVEELTDITDRRIQEHAFREREENLKTLFNSIDDFLFILDAEGRIFQFNPAALQRLGYSADELVGMPVPDIHPLERRDEATTVIEEMLAGKTSECSIPLLAKNGKHIPVETRMTRGTWNGQPVLFAICRDITERMAAQHALEQGEEKYRTLFENAPIGIAIVETEGNVLDANEAMFRLHGLRREGRMTRITTNDWYHNPDDRDKTRARLLEDGFLNEWEVRLKKADGTSYDALITMRPIEIGGHSLWVAMIQDVTEQRQREQALNESLKEKELLLREIHHRVKNNMQIVESLLRLQTSKVKSPELNEIMNDFQSRINAMSLVHETLYHSQTLSRVRVLEYLQSLARSLVQTYAHSDRISIRVSVIPPDTILNPDKVIPLGLAISELVTNALKYAFKGNRSGTVQIRGLKRNNNELEVTVSDNGVGLPEDLDVRQSGTLGLQLVTGLVERQLAGDLEWQVHNGTAFTIRFMP